MKRIAFAYIEKVIDFSSEEEAKKFMEKLESDRRNAFVVKHYREDKDTYTVVTRQKYRNYMTGF